MASEKHHGLRAGFSRCPGETDRTIVWVHNVSASVWPELRIKLRIKIRSCVVNYR